MKEIYYLITVAATLLFASCDVHQEFPDTAMKPCHILCTDVG